MPGHDGLWLLGQVAGSDLDVCIVMVTGDTDVHTAVSCLTRGADDYITKPVDKAQLTQTVAKAVQTRRLRIENKAYREDLERLVGERTAQLEGALQDVRKGGAALAQAYRDSIYRLASAAEYRDSETGGHIRRIGLYSHVIAQHLGCDDDFLELVRLASPMHDVGKIGIRDSILLKPGRLTPEEFEEMKAHTLIGGRLLGGSDYPLMCLAETIAVSHHERFDGSGYPHGLAGENIPLAGRIVAIADVFDALITQRVYKPAFTWERALEILHEESDGHFDPRVLSAFDKGLSLITKVIVADTDPAISGARRYRTATSLSIAKPD